MMSEAEMGVMGLQDKNYMQHQKLRNGLRIEIFPLENSRESMPTPTFQISSIQEERINVFCF